MKPPERAKLDQTITDGKTTARTYTNKDYPKRLLTIGDDNEVACKCDGTRASIKRCAEINPKLNQRERSTPDFRNSAAVQCREKLEITLRMMEKNVVIPEKWTHLVIYGVMDAKAPIGAFTNLGYEVARTPSSGTLRIKPSGYSTSYTTPVQLGSAILGILEKFQGARYEFQFNAKKH